MGLELRPIDTHSLSQLWSMINANPVRHTYVASRLEQHGLAGITRRTLEIIGAFDGERLESAMLFGANLVPIETSQESQRLFTEVLVRQGRRCSSIVGPANEVLQLWAMLEVHWGTARAIRANQPVMMTQTRSDLIVDDRVNYSTLMDLDILFPACVEMFTHEVGLSPLAKGAGMSYRNRVSELISNRKSFVRIEQDQIAFKAEVGCVGAQVAQLQGVWVSPELRGQGIGRHALASVVKYVLQDIAPTVSLYVNDFNRNAIAMYEKVGFKQVDSFATVLF